MLSTHLDYLQSDPAVDLGALAYTLQHRRSTFSYRTAINARTVQHAIDSLKGLIDAPSDSSTSEMLGVRQVAPTGTPKIIGIFTGQGAQWARMGAHLIESSPFAAARLDELDAILQALPNNRPSWTIKGELLADKTTSRLTEAELSQPLCTAVQVLLVDVLRAAGIVFTAVVGHSSGEIGAAYAAGLVSARDALLIAFFRGVHAKLAASPSDSTKRGAMMAVGTSADQARALCAGPRFAGRVQVAAVNSSSSVTLSGDEDAVDEVERLLKEEGTFARKLKVDTAYHSAHMTPCAGPYMASLEGCGIKSGSPDESAGAGTTWYSSVYEGEPMSASRLTSQYWADNMCNAVLFADALDRAVQDNGSFDLAIEVGPHPALKGPAMATLGNTGSLPYTGLLSRGQSDTESLVAGLGFVWTHLGSGSVQFSAVQALLSGLDSSEKNETVLTDLPSYPFDHQRAYWHDSRVFNHFRSRSGAMHAPNTVLGMLCSEATTAVEFQWRNMLRPSEVAWLKGHVLQGQALFPATGYVSQAVEAIRLAALETAGLDTAVSVFKVTDVEIPRALILNGEDANVEIIFTLSSVSRSSDGDLITAEWACSSVAEGGGNNVMLNAKGRVSAQLTPAEPDTLPAEQSDPYNLVDVGQDHFYTNLAKIGYQYSHPFKGVSDIRRKPGYSTGTLTDQSGDAWYDDLIVHPGMLDSALQAVFAAWSFPGDTEIWCLHVPVSVSSITINAFYTPVDQGKKQSTMQFESMIRSRNNAKVVGDIYLNTVDGANGIVQFEGVALVPFMRATPKDDVPMFSFLSQEVASPDGHIAAQGETVSDIDAQLYKDLDRVAYWYVRNASLAIPAGGREQLLEHFQNYLRWCDHMVEIVSSGANPKVPVECNADSIEDVARILARHEDREDLRFIQAVGDKLISTITEGGAMLDHMKETGLLPAMYENGGVCSGPTGRWLGQILAQISHRYPGANILEVGGGSGGTTEAAMNALGTAYGSYTFTDLSPSFVLAAEERFGPRGPDQAERMAFKPFDMTRPPSAQGFVEGSFDVVVAAQVLHFSPDVATSLSNLRSLLKPGGFLVVAETTSNTGLLSSGMTIGTLPGWWNGVHTTGRNWGAALTLGEWEDALRTPGLGFGGIDTVTPDISDSLPISVFVTQAVDKKITLLRDPLATEETQYQTEFGAGSLAIIGGTNSSVALLARKAYETAGQYFSNKGIFDTAQDFASSDMARAAAASASGQVTVLCLTDLDEPLLQDLTETKFDALKTLLALSGTMVWATRGAREDTPFSYMMRGITMAVSTENPMLNVQMFDLDINAGPEAHNSEAAELVGTLLKQHALNSWGLDEQPGSNTGMLWTVEPEVYVRDGRLLITRVLPDEAKNQRYNSRRRDVYSTINAAADKTDILRLGGKGAGQERGSLELLKMSPLRLADAPISTKCTTVNVTHSLLQSVSIGLGPSSFFQLCFGVDIETDKPIIALSGSGESRTLVPEQLCIPLGENGHSATTRLLSTAANLVAEQILSLMSPGSTLLVSESDMAVRLALQNKARGRNVRTVFVTAQPDAADSTFIHPNSPQHVFQSVVPASTAVFVHFSRGPRSDAVRDELFKYLPPACLRLPEEAVLGCEPNASMAQLGPARIDSLAQMLRTAWSDSDGTNPSSLADSIPLGEAASHKAIGEPLAVVDWTATSGIQAKVQPIDEGVLFRPDRTYMFVGMAGELGQSLAAWMLAHGARHVVLTSRNPKVNPKFVVDMERRYPEAVIKAMSADATSRESLQDLYQAVTSALPPIAGVMNGAMVLADDLFENMSHEQFARVAAPKVRGTQLLDDLFRDSPLDFFIVTTSITAVIGWSGQSNYSAANEFMTSLVRNRRDRRGLAGSAINIPAVKGVGYAAQGENGFDFEYFDSLGYINVSEEDLHLLFAEAVLSGRPGSSASPQVVMGVNYVPADLDVKAAHRRDAKFAHFIRRDGGAGADGDQAGQANKSGVRVKVQLQEAKSDEEARVISRDGFIAHLKRTLRMSADEKVDESATLMELGVDSLAAVEIRAWFLKELEVDIPTLSILGGGSIAKLVDAATEKLVLRPSQTEEAPVATTVPATVPAIVPVLVSAIESAAAQTTLDRERPSFNTRSSSSASVNRDVLTMADATPMSQGSPFVFSPARSDDGNGSGPSSASSDVEFDSKVEPEQMAEGEKQKGSGTDASQMRLLSPLNT
jgi:hybrid polyketide synthase/nonribosomal peptide synthetase ACE1